MTSESKLCLVSWNTDGIKNTSKSPQKFSNVLDTLNKLQADIVFLQETHVGPECYQIFKTDLEKSPWECFFTVHSPKSKGVALLIKKESLKFEYICHDEDCSGGYIVLFCYLNDELFTLVNVYNHKDDRIVLGRLKEYLLETAEGVLVIGGDFNTVLHPCLDRRPSNSTSKNLQFRAILEDFTVSLNLKDTWSYLQPNEKGFTRRQNASSSRIDMFFMTEDKLNRLISIQPEKESISDHYPLVLTITVQTVQTTKKPLPKVKMLIKNKKTSDRGESVGKISGAEILSVIKSLPNSKEGRPEGWQISYYRKHQCAMTERLKIPFNNMLKDRLLDKHYKRVEGQHLNTAYLIFTHILAKRLSTFITLSFNMKIDTNLRNLFIITFKTGNQKISWSFLQEALGKLEPIPSSPPPDFSILDSILPKVQESDDLRHLQPDCPLTNPIRNLALNYLKELAQFKCEEIKNGQGEIIYMASVCYQRQSLLIHTKLEKQENNFNDFKQLVKKSGLYLAYFG